MSRIAFLDINIFSMQTTTISVDVKCVDVKYIAFDGSIQWTTMVARRCIWNCHLKLNQLEQCHYQLHAPHYTQY